MQSIKPIKLSQLKDDYFLQSKQWAHIKQTFGWKVFILRQKAYSHLQEDILVLVRKMPVFGYMAYIPDGILARTPVMLEDNKQYESLSSRLFDTYSLMETILEFLVTHYDIFVFSLRWDTPWNFYLNTNPTQELDLSIYNTTFHRDYNSIQHTSTVYQCEPTQPSATMLLNLKFSLEELLANMKQKTRYNIKLASKKGVVIRNEVSIDEFYTLYRITSFRNKISIHQRAYYQKVYDELIVSNKHEIHIYGAEYEQQLIATIIVVYYSYQNKKEAIYLYGASSDIHRNLMPAYALQWHAIKEAKKQHCSSYDMFGIPPYADETHRMYGVYKFKIGFGGTVMLRLGGYEVVNHQNKITRKLYHKLFILLEKMRKWYYYKYKK